MPYRYSPDNYVQLTQQFTDLRMNMRPFLFVISLSIFLFGSLLNTYGQPPPAISSFTPSSVCEGGIITISGTNFTGATVVQLGGANAASFNVINDGTIEAVAGAAVVGNIMVTTPTGSNTSTGVLTILAAPTPLLKDISNPIDQFTNCKGNSVYQLTVGNVSTPAGGSCDYTINWGDASTPFTQTNWPVNAQTSHTYNTQGYFNITLTITAANGCIRSVSYNFYNGTNPLASFTTTNPTTGLCTPAPVEFQIGNWYNNSPGTTYRLNYGDGSAPDTLTHPLNANNIVKLVSHTYLTSSCPRSVDYTATLDAINGCFKTTYTLNQIVVRKKPIADFTAQSSACINTPVCFTNTTTDGFSGGNRCVATSDVVWDFGDGTTSTAATPACHSYSVPGTYTVTLTASNTSCGSNTRTKDIVIQLISAVPLVTSPVSYCVGQQAVPLKATGAALLWYSSATGGIGSATAPTPSTTTAGNTTFYVSQTIGNECESPRIPIVVTIYPNPAAPLVSTPVQLCQNQVAAPLMATGTGLLWYTGASGGTGSATAPTPSTSSVGTTIYYVSQTTNGCEGPRAAITVIVNSLATAPSVQSPVVYCQNQPAAALTASGVNLLWYFIPTGGVGNANAPKPSTNIVGTTVYYVSQTTGCGEGPRAAISVDVNAGPTASIAYPNPNLCNAAGTATNPNPDVPVTITGTAGGIYSILPQSGLTINPSTGTIKPAGAIPGQYTITYTIIGTGGCADLKTVASINISATPTATISYPGACTSDANVNVQITGSTGGSYSSTAGLTINSTTGGVDASTSTPGTYTVTYTILASAPCPGFVTTGTITITKAPTASIAYNPLNLCNVVNTPATPNAPIAVILTGTAGGSYTISPANGLIIDAVTGTISPSGATAGNYTVKYTIAGAGGCAVVATTTTVSVSGAPTATISYPLQVCSADATTAVTLAGSTGGIFTSTTGLTIDPLTGTITPSSSVPGTYLVTYTISPSAPCPGFIATAGIMITKAPAATIVYTPATVCNVVNTPTTPNAPIAVTLTGTTGGSYAISPAGLPIDPATGTISPAGATAGNYKVTYTVAGAGGCPDFTTTAIMNVSGAPGATISYLASPYCQAMNTPQAVQATGTSGGVFSAGTGLSLNASTGSINPSLSTAGTYTVSYTIAALSPCPGYIATTSVQIDESPAISFTVLNRSICSGGTALFTPSSTVANTAYTWSLVGALPVDVAGVIAGAASGPAPVITLSFTNMGNTPATLDFDVIPTNPSIGACAGKPARLKLVVNPVPATPINDTFNLCMGNAPLQLTVNPSPGNTIRWYNDQFVLLPAAPIVATNLPKRYDYYATEVNGYGCESPRALLPAIVNPTAKIISSSYTDPTMCGVPSGSIILNVLDLNNNGVPDMPLLVHYTKFQTAYKITASTDASGKIVIPMVAGTYTNLYVETSGCPSQKIPDVFILKDPISPAKPLAGYNPPLCSGTPLSLTASSPTSSQTGPIDYIWVGPAFGSVADTSRNTVVTFPSASVTDAGTYIVYAIQNNCISLPVSFDVIIKQSPTKPVIDTRTPLCIGDELILRASSSIPGGSGLNYLWTGPGAGFPVNGANASVSKVKLQDGGRYVITVQSPQTGCSASSDTLIEIGGNPIVQFAQDSLTLPTGHLLKLLPVITNASAGGILPIKKYEWTPTTDLACTDSICASPIATIKNNLCYSVKATNIYGCSGSDVICVKVFCQGSQVFIPNAFTPQGLPENSKLMVRASGIASVKSFRIFNRWGRLMYERNNFPPNDPGFGWDGRLQGKYCDPGVYVYTTEVICENGIPYFYKGNVTLL